MADSQNSRKRPWAAAALIAVIVVLGLVWTVSGLVGGDDTPPAAAAPASAPTAPPAEPSVCGLTEVAMTGTVQAAPVTTWTLVGTTAAPAVDGDGPGKVEPSGMRSCYARTPTGALVAAANYAALGAYPPVRSQFERESTVPGPGRDALLAAPSTGRDASTVRFQIVGFRVLRYTGEQADIDLALRSSNGALAGYVNYLQWVDGDWKVRLADNGDALATATQLSDVTGYLPWAGA